MICFTNEISETRVQTPSSIINGKYFINIDAKQAIPAPIRFSKIKDKSPVFILPVILRMKARSI